MKKLKPKKLEIERLAIYRNSGLRAKVWDRDQGICVDCSRYSPRWQHDHVIPLSMGGSDTLHNSVTRCQSCHRRKSNRETSQRAKCDRLRQRHELTKQRRQLA